MHNETTVHVNVGDIRITRASGDEKDRGNRVGLRSEVERESFRCIPFKTDIEDGFV